MNNFWSGFEKRAISRKALAGIGGGLAAVGGGLAYAKHKQPYDTVGLVHDVHSDTSPKGTKYNKGNMPPAHARIEKKRPLFFGKKKHMAEAKDPKMVAVASGNPVLSPEFIRSLAKQRKGRVAFTDNYRSDWTKARKQKKDLRARKKGTKKWKDLDDSTANALYDSITK